MVTSDVRRRAARRLVALALLCLASVPVPAAQEPSQYADAQRTALLANGAGRLELAAYLEILVDAKRNFLAEDVLAGRYDERFSPLPARPVGLGFKPVDYWLRFSYRVAEDSPRVLPLLDTGFVLLDRVDVYTRDGRGLAVQTAGDTLPFRTRAVDYRAPVFRLPATPGVTHTALVRVRSGGTVHLPFRLWSETKFLSYVGRSNLLFGVYYGSLLATAIGAFLAFVFLRSWLFLAYALYIVSFSAFQFTVNGFSLQYLWPGDPESAAVAPTVFDSLCILFGAQFISLFLDFKRHIPILNKMVWVMTVGALAAVVLSFSGFVYSAARIIMVEGLVLSATALLAALWIAHKGYRPAVYFVIGWGLFLFGVFVTSLFYLGLLPYSFFAEYAMQMGSSFEIVLLTMAIVVHYTERERLRQRGIDAQNRTLEGLVHERTVQLEERNRRLTHQAEHDGLTGLLNHSNIVKRLQTTLSEGARYRFPTSVLMLDLDDFKAINDRFGHLAGDHVLTAVSELLASLMRDSDVCGRYGGEEFLVVLGHADEQAAQHFARRIQNGLANLSIGDLQGGAVAASIGVASVSGNGAAPQPDEVIERADQALYRAKRAGKNRVMAAANGDVIDFPVHKDD